MKWYPWLTPYYRQLIQENQQGFSHPAMLMRSVATIENELLVNALARRLLCQTPNGLKRCGHCHSCQLTNAGNHPDWLIIQVASGKSSIGIEPIREMIERLTNFPTIGITRIIWIKKAQLLTEAAANALLKTLEEPPENCRFFLTIDTASRLPATLVSRCRIFLLPTPAEDDSLACLAESSSAELIQNKAALRISAGAPAAALTLLTSPDWSQRELLYQRLWFANSDTPASILVELNRGHTIDKLFWLQTLLIDVIKKQQGLDNWFTNSDKDDLISHLAGLMPSLCYQRLLDYWLNCRQELLLTPGLNQELLLLEGCLLWESLQKPHSPMVAI